MCCERFQMTRYGGHARISLRNSLVQAQTEGRPRMSSTTEFYSSLAGGVGLCGLGIWDIVEAVLQVALDWCV